MGGAYNGTRQNAEVVAKAKSSHHSLVRAKITQHEQNMTKFSAKKRAHVDIVMIKKIRIALENKYEVSEQREKDNMEGMNENTTAKISEAALGGRALSPEVTKLSQTAKDPINKHMKITSQDMK